MKMSSTCQCYICWSGLGQDPATLTTLSCSHVYHSACIQADNMQCPQCKVATKRKIQTIALAVCGGAVVGTLALPVLAVPALAAVGFTANGVAAGSIAAGIHATIGNVAAGSLFAFCQSVGATGIIPAVASAVAAAGGAAGGAALAGRTT